jgi:hypothetical protein
MPKIYKISYIKAGKPVEETLSLSDQVSPEQIVENYEILRNARMVQVTQVA